MNKRRKGIRITNGRAVSIGKDLYYMQGPSHELGGIDVGKNLEVEGGEIMQVNKDNIKVFSAQPILNGISPAEKILGGGSPNKVFNEQERYKDRNGLNDDGSIKSSSTGGRDRTKQRNRTITKDLNNMNEQYKCGGKSKKPLGGLNRSKDYGSKDKSYPKVKSSDFAGGDRSYPIPTKADAIDALRLAGLHDRSDVRTKVYRKYPELKKRNGGVITINGNVVDKLVATPRRGRLGLEDKIKYKAGEDYELITDNNLFKRNPIENDYVYIYSDANKDKIIPPKINLANSEFPTPNDKLYNSNLHEPNPIVDTITTPQINVNTYKKLNNDVGFNFGNIESNRLREQFGFSPSKTYAISKKDNLVDETSNKKVDDINLSSGVNTTNKSTRTSSNRAKTSTNTNQNIPTSNIKISKFPEIKQAGINIPKTDFNKVVINPVKSYMAQPSTEERDRTSKVNNLINDIGGLGSNLLGTGLSYANTRRTLKNMQAPTEPIYEQAQKLITDYNISPQLSDIEEQTKQMMDVIGANTATGRARIQRVQRAMNAALSAKNQLRGQKENIETQLKNADIMNRQNINARNVAAKNAWINNVINFQNNIREQLASNRNRLYSGINAGVQDMLTRRENRRQYNNTLGIYAATHPNVDKRLFEKYGVKF